MKISRAIRAAAIALFVLSSSSGLCAQWMGRQTGCYAPTIEANPNRPTVANPADITQYGVLELEYGWDRTSLGAGARLTDFTGLLKFGLLCDVEVRWNTTTLLAENAQAGGQTGIGDNWFGPQIRFYRQTKFVPTLALSYAVKVPTASTAKGLGSGRVDHSFTFLTSKDVLGAHFDFNATYFLIRRTMGPGFDSNYQFNLSLAHSIKGRLAFTGEFYGNTKLDAATPGFASTLWALTFAIKPRLVIDGGVDVGLTHGAPQKRFFAGVTYSIANLYEAVKGRKAGGGNRKHSD